MIEIQELFKYYGDRRAIGPVSASIAQGEVVGLLGLNGAGKTTTLRVLACDLLPTSGTVRVDGRDVVEKPDEVRQRVGYLPDIPPLYGDMTVSEYLAYAARLRRVPRTDVARRVDDVIGMVELGRERHTLIAALSHGFKQRVGIAQAIVHRPALVVLDEPISGLDPAQIIEMRKLVRGLRGEHTVLVSSHILPEIQETCDRILVIRDGRIEFSGSEQELLARQAGMRIELTLRVGDAAATERARELIEAIDAVDLVEPMAPTEPGDDVVSFDVQCADDVRPEICRALVGAGIGLLEVSRSQRGLESAFLDAVAAASLRSDGSGLDAAEGELS